MAEAPIPESTGREINILVLGETGVGKSTWINSFANYLQYDSLEEAEKNELVNVIPTSFTITDDNYEERVITTGSDSNEVHRAGESATQRPRTYTFPYNEIMIRIIDTPGIGDSRGPSQDKLNFQMIMDHLACYKEVHAICILLKPNNARITVLFEFCIKHLLTHLHRDAIRNIVFCFTNARNTFYRPGQTLPALRQLLSNFQDFEIPLDKTTMYCLDNESIQFLAAVEAGINFQDQREVYAKSWEVSSTETQRLLQHIIQLEPHVLQNTLSLNDARRVVLGLTQPLTDIGKNIQKNILQAKKKQQEVEVMNSKDRESLEERLYIPVVSFSVHYLDRPYQVCTAGKCCKVVRLDSGQESTKHLCQKPSQKSVLRYFKFRPKNCSRCHCPKSLHTDINYEILEEMRQEKSVGLNDRIRHLDFSIENIRNEFLVELLDRIKVLEKEQAEILTISSQFAHFLKTNAIAPYNDTMIRYLDQQIETAKLSPNGTGDENLQVLMKMKSEYEAEVEVLKTKMENSTSDGIQCWQIPVLKQELISLPINGPHLRDILDKQDSMPAGVDERVVDVTRSGKKAGRVKKIFGIPTTGTKALKQQKSDPKVSGASRSSVKHKGKQPPPAVPPKPGPQMLTRQSAVQVQSEIASKPRPPVASTIKPEARVPQRPGQSATLPKVPARPLSQPAAPAPSSAVPPPPPPPPTKFPAIVRSADAVDGARSTLLTQIHKGVTLKKVDPRQVNPRYGGSSRKPLPRTPGPGTSENSDFKPSSPNVPLDAALKRALSDRFRAHNTESVDVVDEDGDNEWLD